MHDQNRPSDTEYTRIIDTAIEAFMERQMARSSSVGQHYQDLWTEIARLMSSGGKRLRSKITLLAYQGFGGEDVEAVIPAAAAMELLHLGMLIHDDIIDRDYIRYGVDNIVGGYIKLYDNLVDDESDRLHYSNSAAILAGDLMISEAYQMMAESKIEASKVLAIQKLLGAGLFEVIGGELLDTEAVFRGKAAASAESIARYKTASYTTILPMLVGAELADVSKENQQLVKDSGCYLGIAFQLRDDVIGVFGSEDKIGKSTTGDIREGKQTYMVEQFYDLATTEQRTQFEKFFGNNSINDQQVAKVRQLLVASGALENTERVIDEYEAKARASLSELAVTPGYEQQFDQLISALTKRVK